MARQLNAHAAGAAILAGLLIAGCQASRQPEPPMPPESDAHEHGGTEPEPPTTAGNPASRTGDTDPVMLVLLEESRRAAESGNLDASIASLERALRIDPGRADLWTALARAHLKADEPDAALGFAQRAVALAGNRAEWLRAAWLAVADARSQLGDEDIAREIRRRWRADRG